MTADIVNVILKTILCLDTTPRSHQKMTENNIIFKWSSSLQTVDNHRIFFHETSGRQSLNLRQNCAVESAAKENPSRSVQLFLAIEKLNYSDTWLSVLRQYDNIQVILINETEYFAQSPLESWYREGVWRKSPFQKEHLADYIRMLSLFKGGGLYMDLDFITLKPLDEKILWNFFPFPKADRSRLTNSIFHLQHGHRLIEEILRKLAASYYLNEYDEHGPILVTEALTSVCGFEPEQNSSFLTTAKCPSVRLIPHQFFYPIPYSQWKKYFHEADAETLLQIEQSYAVHVWNQISSGTRLVRNSNQLYIKLANQHCPLTIQHAANFVDVHREYRGISVRKKIFLFGFPLL